MDDPAGENLDSGEKNGDERPAVYGTVEVAVVGNGVAGFTCARRLARAGIKPLLIGPGLPTDRPPLSKLALATGVPRLFADARQMEEQGITLLDGMVVRIDTTSRKLTVQVNDELVEVTARRIVWAAGIDYRTLEIDGLAGTHLNATPAGLKNLVARLQAPRRIVVVGAGLVGVESAITLSKAGHALTVVDVADEPLARLHAPLPELASKALADYGITFRGGALITHAEVEDGVATLHTREHGTLTADVVVSAVGGAVAGVPGMEMAGPIEVGPDMSVPGVEGLYVVGDAAVFDHSRFGRIHCPQWDAAVGTAEYAADAIAGIADRPYDRMLYWWSDLGDVRLSEYGWARAATSWADEDGLHVGRDDTGGVVAVLVVGQPKRRREAMMLVGT
jgi:3-phenylpropionate/trans-cinnamate dioxygenase ferredoxin reductase subunit